MNTRLDILLRASLNTSVSCALDVIAARQDQIFTDFWFVWSAMLVFSGDISSIALGVWPLTLYPNILSKQLSGIWSLGQVGSILRSQLMACNLDHNSDFVMSRFRSHIVFSLVAVGGRFGTSGKWWCLLGWWCDRLVQWSSPETRDSRLWRNFFNWSFSDSPRPNSVKRHKKTFCRRLLSGSPEV